VSHSETLHIHKYRQDASVLFQNYIKGELIGEGSFGNVFMATEKSTGKKFALKQINKLNTSATAFKKEAWFLQFLNHLGGHRNIVGLEEVYEDKKYYYLVLELVSGGEVFEHLIQKGAYSEQTAARLLRDVVDALAFLHAHGLVHLDLKPENLVLSSKDPSAIVKLVDFGSAARAGLESRSMVGTKAYWPPETQGGGKTILGPSIDMWALGVIMFILLVGVHPFDVEGGLPDHIVGRNIVLQEPPLDSELTKNISESALDLIRKLMDRDPAKRLTAEQVANHPWIKGESATHKLLLGLDEKLKSLQMLRRKLEARMFATLIHRSSEVSDRFVASKEESTLQPSSVEEASNALMNILKVFDVSNKGFVSGRDFAQALFGMMGSDMDEKEKEYLKKSIQASSADDEGRLGLADIVQLAKSYTIRTYKDGDIIFRAGEPGDCMYFINSGRIHLSHTDRDGRVTHLTTLKPGRFLGESALLDGVPRNATARCETDVELLTISKESFLRMTQDAPEAMARVKILALERNLEHFKSTLRVMSHVKHKVLSKGEYLVRQGAAPGSIYTVVEGDFLIQKNGTGKPKSMAVRKVGAILGETWLVDNAPHPHSIICDSDQCVVSEISSDDITELFSHHPRFSQVLENLYRIRSFRSKISHLLPEDEMHWTREELRKAFDNIVTGQGGRPGNSINMTQLKTVMHGLDGFHQNDEEISLLMSLIDHDGDGRISFDEFVRVMNEEVYS